MQCCQVYLLNSIYSIPYNAAYEVSLADMFTEINEGTSTNKVYISFIPECDIEKIQLIYIEGTIIDGANVTYNGKGVYIVKNGEIYKTLVNTEVTCQIIDGEIQYGQTRTLHSTQLSCTLFYR